MAGQPVLTRVPDGGIQPQAAVDSTGMLHLVYFKGDPKAGDLFYVRRPRDSNNFEPRIRVSSASAQAIALGTIRGAQMVLGNGNTLHIVWNGAKTAAAHAGPALFYARLNSKGTAFELEQDLMGKSSGLDGGASVAADANGNVFAFWHGWPAGITQDESHRCVLMANSTNQGKSFAAERVINSEPDGACGCCGLKAFSAPSGELFVMYRTARNGSDRAETLLRSRDAGRTFDVAFKHPWQTTTCPMTLVNFYASSKNLLAAWETAGRVWFGKINASGIQRPVNPPGAAAQKYPVVVQNSKGEVLLAWNENTSWGKGGVLSWQRWDNADGNVTSASESKPSLPSWSFAAAICRADDKFEIIY